MKVVLIVVATLISIVVVTVLIGFALPATHVAKTKTTFRATPEQVWDAITNVNAFPSWRSDVNTVETLPAVNGRSAWREDGSNGKISYEQTQAVRGSRLQVRLTDDTLPFGGTWTYEISRVEGGSELTITEDGIVRNPIFRFVSRFVFGHYKTQETYLADLGKTFGQTVSTARIMQ